MVPFGRCSPNHLSVPPPLTQSQSKGERTHLEVASAVTARHRKAADRERMTA